MKLDDLKQALGQALSSLPAQAVSQAHLPQHLFRFSFGEAGVYQADVGNGPGIFT